jgi:hypothetical protein
MVMMSSFDPEYDKKLKAEAKKYSDENVKARDAQKAGRKAGDSWKGTDAGDSSGDSSRV